VANTQKSFDVKVNVVYPHISKTIPEKDSKRIQTTNFFKYEPQKAVTQPDLSLYQPPEEKEAETNETRMKKLDGKLEEMESEFKRLEDKTEKSFQNYVYTYEIDDASTEAIANAEEAIFGVATGIITQAKYKKVLELLDTIDQMLVDATIENGGKLNVGGS
jgi:hypothetical protein